jgi:hypothetical protein
MISAVQRWFHRHILHHGVHRSRVTVPLFSPDKGWLYRCQCGKVWAE